MDQPIGGPCTPNLPRCEFVGAIRQRPFGGGAGVPFGHLEFDYNELRIFGFGMYVSVRKSGIDHVRIARRILVSRISVVFADGERSDVYFAMYGHEGIRAELIARGWPVRVCRG